MKDHMHAYLIIQYIAQLPGTEVPFASSFKKLFMSRTIEAKQAEMHTKSARKRTVQALP